MKHTHKIIPILLLATFLLTGCSESIRNAGYNTLLGMGMAFLVLIIIALVIRLFPAITAAIENKGENKKLAEKAIDQTTQQIAKKEETAVRRSAGDDEIAAVIAAAVAAYEADTGMSPGNVTAHPALGAPRGQAPVVQAPPGYQGYYVRSLRRVANSKWKRN